MVRADRDRQPRVGNRGKRSLPSPDGLIDKVVDVGSVRPADAEWQRVDDGAVYAVANIGGSRPPLGMVVIHVLRVWALGVRTRYSKKAGRFAEACS